MTRLTVLQLDACISKCPMHKDRRAGSKNCGRGTLAYKICCSSSAVFPVPCNMSHVPLRFCVTLQGSRKPPFGFGSWPLRGLRVKSGQAEGWNEIAQDLGQAFSAAFPAHPRGKGGPRANLECHIVPARRPHRDMVRLSARQFQSRGAEWMVTGHWTYSHSVGQGRHYLQVRENRPLGRE